MPITLDPVTKIISITAPTIIVTIQELVDEIRDWEDEVDHLQYNKVIDAVGKAALGGGVFTAITMTLSAEWQIQFWNGVGLGIIKDGNIVGGVGGEVIKPTGGADTIEIINSVGGVIIVSGSGVLPADITAIAQAVWDEDDAMHPNPGTTGKILKEIIQSMDNRLVINEIASELWLYADDGVNIIKKWPLIDGKGNDINVTEVTGPVSRGERTL